MVEIVADDMAYDSKLNVYVGNAQDISNTEEKILEKALEDKDFDTAKEALAVLEEVAEYDIDDFLYVAEEPVLQVGLYKDIIGE